MKRLMFLPVLLLSVLSMLAGVGKNESVGLVLSGGGAKGIAHIGVIKALEENNIPIDYVAGTSMGAIVGGLYSMGYTPEEMMELITSKEFAAWSTGRIDEKLVHYFSKPRPTPALLQVPISKTDTTKSVVPASIISPLPMNFAFMELFSAYTAQCGKDFNKLFVPFRCVISDVDAKRKIVCSRGNLGDAIRGSMSFPAVFQPIEIDGVLAYDGGIYDNFPVDVMREDFAPDVIIGVNVSSGNAAPKTGSLYEQLENLIMQGSSYELPADEGVKISVGLSEFGLLDFPKAKEIYQKGYDKAMSMIDSIKGRVNARESGESLELRRRVFKSKTPYLRFDSVKVEGGTDSQNDYITYLFTKNRPDTFGIATARSAYYQAITPGTLRNLMPRAEQNDSTGLFSLDLKASVKDNFRVGFGGFLTSTTNSMIFLSGGYNTLSYHGIESNLNVWVGQSYYAGCLNGKMFLPTPIPSSLELQLVASRQKYYESSNLFYEDKTPTFIHDKEYFARLSYAMAAGRSGKMSVGVGWGQLYDTFYQNSQNEYTNAGRDETTYKLWQARLNYTRNTLDNQSYPTSGAFYSLTAIGVTGKYQFSPFHEGTPAQYKNTTWGQVRLEAKNYFPLSRKFSVGTAVDILASTRQLVNNYDAAIVNAPAFTPTSSSYNTFNSAFRANAYGSVGLIPVCKLSDFLQLRGDFYCFMPYKKIIPLADGITAGYGKAFHDPQFYGEVAAVYNFPFAALTAYGNYLSAGPSKWNVGVSFGLFFLSPRFLK